MNPRPAAAAPWPLITVQLRPDGTAEVDRLGTTHTITASDVDQARDRVRKWVAEQVATPTGRPVAVTITEPQGLFHIKVAPDGTPSPSDHGIDKPARSTGRAPAPATEPAPAATPPIQEERPRAAEPAAADSGTQPYADYITGGRREQGQTDPGEAKGWTAYPPPENGPDTTPQRKESPQTRKSFITAGRSIPPATEGWRGALNMLGLRLPPGPAEAAMRVDVEAVSQHWGGPRTIAVVNGKGSASKTPTTACLAAVFARYGGAGALAWDNNETRGSLAWRTEGAAHQATVLDLLPRVDALMSSSAQYAELAHYVHHQPGDKYDVLWSDQSVSGDHIVTAEDVEKIHQVAARYYRLIVMDSGNSERAPNWRAMVEKADRLVVPCTNVEDTAEAGARLIEALSTRDPQLARLAETAVVIVSQRTPGRDENLGRIVAGYRDMGLTVVTIPYDQGLTTGVIRFDALRDDTQRAWLRAAAEIARGL